VTDTLTIELQPIASPREVQTFWFQNAPVSQSFFTSWTWLGTWLELLPLSAGVQLLILAKGNQRGLALLFPRKSRRHRLLNVRQLHFNSTGDPEFDSVFIEHNGFAGLDADLDVWRRLEQWFLAGQANADELVIPGVESSGALAFARALQQRRDVPAFRIALKAMRDQGGLEGGLSRNSRQQLRRAMRAYGPTGSLTLETACRPDQALGYFDALKALHIRSWTRRGKPHAFRHAFFEIFHRVLIARGVADGSVRLIRVSAGGDPIGYLYNFRYRGAEYAYQSGFEDSDPDLRPGYVCHALAIEAATAAGADTYDFLAGANRLKQSFANEQYVMSWTTLTQPTVSLRAAAAIGATAKAIKGGFQG
jgi:hypothetical protein